MGKKGYGKRIMRLDKQERRDISGTGDGAPRGRKNAQGQTAGKLENQSQSNVHLAAMLRLTQAGPRKVSSYSDRQKILTVGDGDFSFSLSLASSVGGSNLIATSLDKRTQVQVKYGQGTQGTMHALESMGAVVHNQVDATKLQECNAISNMKFDRIVFNFPDLAEVTPSGQPKEVTVEPLSHFLGSAAGMLSRGEDSEVHVTLRSRDVQALGKQIKVAAAAAGLQCVLSEPLDLDDFMGYRPKHTYPAAPGQISLTPARILKFKYIGQAATRKRAKDIDEESEEEEEEDNEEELAGGAEQAKRKKSKKKKRKTGWDDAKKDDHRLVAPKPKESRPVSDARAAALALFGR